jgi:MFS family permease
MVPLLALVVAGIALLAVANGLTQLGAGMVLAGLGIAPAIACLYLLVDRLAPAGTVTEAFTWVTTAFSTGFAIGNALGGSLVHRVGTDRSFLIAAAGIAAARCWPSPRPECARPPRGWAGQDDELLLARPPRAAPARHQAVARGDPARLGVRPRLPLADRRLPVPARPLLAGRGGPGPTRA